MLMGIEHEHIHYETSTVLIRQYPIDMVTKPIGWIYGPTKSSDYLDFKMNKTLEFSLFKYSRTNF